MTPRIKYTIILEDADGLGDLGSLSVNGQKRNLKEIAEFFNATYPAWKVVEALVEYPVTETATVVFQEESLNDHE